jgi:hypothetical protein
MESKKQAGYAAKWNYNSWNTASFSLHFGNTHVGGRCMLVAVLSDLKDALFF